MRDASAITDQNHWINAHAAFLYASDIATAQGWALEVPFVIWLHGSANSSDGTLRGAYKTRMRQLVTDLRAMIGAAALVDASAAQVIVDQVSYRHDARRAGLGDAATG